MSLWVYMNWWLQLADCFANRLLNVLKECFGVASAVQYFQLSQTIEKITVDCKKSGRQKVYYDFYRAHLRYSIVLMLGLRQIKGATFLYIFTG